MKTLNDWLSHVETLHAKTIDLGLDRIKAMIRKMDIRFDCPILLVGGTNGKGSTCTCLEQVLLAAGYHVGVHTSPHLIRFNERARIDGKIVTDEDLLPYFEKVEALRGETTLSYFEYTLLVILMMFQARGLDVLVLEIGLGGRLDAVNALEPSGAIVTTVGVDHTQFLGNTREEIGLEKAHIYRAGKPAVCADPLPPSTLVEHAKEIGADFITSTDASEATYAFTHLDGSATWTYRFKDEEAIELPLPSLPGEHQIRNAAGALTLLFSLRDKLPFTTEAVKKGLQSMRVTGRFEIIRHDPEVVLDVGHNPHAAYALRDTLKAENFKGRTVAVFGMLADKDREHVCEILKDSFDEWFVADLEGPRGGSAEDLVKLLSACGVATEKMHSFEKVKDALSAALGGASGTDRIVIFGSFLTVSAAVEALDLTVN